jgi:hypothetical protein
MKNILFILVFLLPAIGYAQITAEFEYDANVCGNQVSVSDISTGETVISRAWYMNDVLLTADGPADYTFSTGTINSADTIMVSLVVQGSTSSDSVAHQVICFEQPVVDAGDDFDVCGYSAHLSANATDTGGTWLPVPGATFEDHGVLETDVYQSIGSGEYDFVFQLSDEYCTVSDTVTVTFWRDPTAELVMDPADTATCGTIFSGLQAADPGASVDSDWLVSNGDYDPGTGIWTASDYGNHYAVYVESNGPDNLPPEFCADTAEPWYVHFKDMPDVDIITEGGNHTSSTVILNATTGYENGGPLAWSCTNGNVNITTPAEATTEAVFTGEPGEAAQFVLEADNMGCYDSDTLLIHFFPGFPDSAEALEEVSDEPYWLNQPGNGAKNISLYPNPASGHVKLQAEPEAFPMQVSLYDTGGRCLKQRVLENISQSISTEALKSGMYVLRIRDVEGNTNRIYLLVE